MLIEYYPSPVVPYTPSNSVVMQGDILLQATKRGLTPVEYRKRKKLVKDAAEASDWKVGEWMYPVTKEDYDTSGMVRVFGICRDFDHYGELEWHNPPFILTVTSGGTISKFINCTNNWVQRELPAYLGQDDAAKV